MISILKIFKYMITESGINRSRFILSSLLFLIPGIFYSLHAHAHLTAAERQALAQRFRPYFKTSIDSPILQFDEPERVRPCNWQWFVGRCNLVQNGKIILSASQLNANPARLLDPPAADIRTSPSIRPGYELKLVDTANRHGEPWESVINNGHGIYAHVEEIDATLVNIEYIILWPYNLSSVFGDHGGDLTTMTVIYDRDCDMLVRVTYVIHGSVIATFRITHPTKIAFVPLTGQDKNGNKITVDAAYLEIADDDERQDGPWWHSPCDRDFVYLARDPVSLLFEHPVAYIEWGTHELWPAPCGSVTSSPEHNGTGLSFIPAVVQLLGTLNEPEPVHIPFIYYNGKWGDDPAALLLHRTWYWPEGRANNRFGIPEGNFVDRSPYEQHDKVAWPPFHEYSNGPWTTFVNAKNYFSSMNGTSQAPFRTVDQALTFVPRGGPIVIHSGSYPEQLVITRSGTLSALGGAVIIGKP